MSFVSDFCVMTEALESSLVLGIRLVFRSFDYGPPTYQEPLYPELRLIYNGECDTIA